uniref:Uncharacterized protein n=1 Tax=Cucumis melo TaxID=3656 RepID=A0A9I9CVJ3_CUCME
MKVEGFEEISFTSKLEFLLSSNSIPSTQRSPYKLFERFFNHLDYRPISTHRNMQNNVRFWEVSSSTSGYW